MCGWLQGSFNFKLHWLETNKNIVNLFVSRAIDESGSSFLIFFSHLYIRQPPRSSTSKILQPPKFFNLLDLQSPLQPPRSSTSSSTSSIFLANIISHLHGKKNLHLIKYKISFSINSTLPTSMGFGNNFSFLFLF